MKSQGHRLLDNAEGRGLDISIIVLMGWPSWGMAPATTHYNMEADVKTEASR